MVSTKKFYQNVDVTFEGVIPESDDLRKSLSDQLDVIVQRLPDEDVFNAHGHIYFSFPAEII